jgi:hypothetical protein
LELNYNVHNGLTFRPDIDKSLFENTLSFCRATSFIY